MSRLGINHAKQFFLTGRTFDCRSLLEQGFLTAHTESDELSTHVQELAHDICKLAPVATQDVKQALNAYANGCQNEDLIWDRMIASLQSSDFNARLLAIQEKRTP